MRPLRARRAAPRALRALAPLFFFATLVAALPRSAWAWVEASVTAHSATVALDAAGRARVTHDILLRVRGGPLEQFDVPGVDLDAAPEGEATATPVRERDGGEGGEEVTGAPSPLRAELRAAGTLRLSPREKGLKKGTYRVRVSYRTDLVKSGALRRDGALVALQWFGPRWPGGVDNDRCVFVVPASPTPPRPAAEGDAEASAVGVPYQTASRRTEAGDELELVRAHVAQGERAAWRIRVDPRALAEVTDRRVVPPSPEALEALEGPSSDERRAIALVGLGLFLLASALTALKNRQAALHAAAAGARVPPLVPLPGDARAALAGAAAALGVGLQLAWRSPLAGTLVLLAAMALMAHRPPVALSPARPPGRWLVVSEDDAFAPGPRVRDAFLDAGTPSGRLLLAAVALCLAALAAWLERVAPAHAPLVLLDGLALVPLFFTGRRGELPPSLARAPAPLLRRVLRALQKADPSLRAVPFVRFVRGTGEPDELRLLVKSAAGPEGLQGLEIGCAYAIGPGGPALGVELLVRVRGGSAAEAFLRANAPGARWSDGRAEGERVATLEPDARGVRPAAELARRTLADLRAAAPAAQASSASSSAGRGERASKGETPSPPLQPTKVACSA
ncbi:MAG TPA: hypothetical protein VFS43_18200 [Polyangiaceae bacterium]|nr:hypothetical protein [Polyangiaceae bacterium]